MMSFVEAKFDRRNTLTHVPRIERSRKETRFLSSSPPVRTSYSCTGRGRLRYLNELKAMTTLTKQKIFHANLLKKYLSANQSEPSDESSTQESTSVTGNITFAAILEPEEKTSENAVELQTLNPLQKKTVKDVKINPDLLSEQQSEVRTLGVV